MNVVKLIEAYKLVVKLNQFLIQPKFRDWNHTEKNRF